MKVGNLAPLEVEVNDIMKNQIVLYTNPATDVVKVAADTEVVQNIKVYNMAGLLVDESPKSEFWAAHLSSGIYLVSVKTGQAVHHHKLVRE